ncbi:MAG: biotin/lipoyl-binding protein [Gammaproteobacteria bacterium]|nr:MAG: biotin/lipoyl-binding protein [Gammaproteobacteria bacterium]
MIRSLLIANRGEIAVRIMATARRLGIRSIAVFSDADRDAMHVAMADDAVRIGPAAARESYLDQQAVIDAARRSGAEAVHPGYGFLAENADFAAACEASGLRFVGPPPEAIRIMGAKDAARQRMQAAGVPVVPGADGDELNADPLAAAADVGYPLLIKASAGGGGKGMRVVRDPADFESALAAVKREASTAFGDSRVLLERWLERARHVEVQVFADSAGSTVHLFDRDCSVQRRQQKVVEEAPAPDLPSALKERMAAAAVAAAEAVGYVGAGTVEFLVVGDEFFFLEMNTRLQVEHPVTELITGEDLVAWQLMVASGLPLPKTQEEIRCSGHAVEVRLYAEDPASGYLPATGRLDRLMFPDDLPGLRVDTGVRQGDVVSPHYDPMIAKFVAWGADRDAALDVLARGLAAVRVHGVRTNLDLLRSLVTDPALRSGAVHTAWLESEASELANPPLAALTLSDLARAALAVVLLRRRTRSGDLMLELGPMRLNASVMERVTLEVDDETVRLHVEHDAEGYRVVAESGASVSGSATLNGDCLESTVDGELQRDDLILDARSGAPALTLMNAHGARTFRLADALAAALDRDEAVAGSLLAPMPGQVVSLMVAEGESVAEGDVLLVLEAMKMEHSIRAPQAGVVSAVNFAVGDRVEEGAVLAAIDPQ